MFDPKVIIDLLANNVRKSRNPFGLSHDSLNTWWKGNDFDRDGSTMLFTGMMYQLVPYINATTGYLEKYEDTPAAGKLRFGRYVPKFMAGTALKLAATREDRQFCNRVFADIVRILEASGVGFCYRPELDEYSGVLLYDLGDQQSFVEHARAVAGRLQEAGIEKVITVDPHTTYALKVLYPKYTGISFEVHTYFELADLKGSLGDEAMTLHDPCFYGRYLELSDVPLRLLQGLGVRCQQVNSSGAFTSCCGGPAESVSPKLAEEVGVRRVAELKSTGCPIVAMCPICLVNLQRAGAEVRDLSSVLARCIG